MPVSWEFIESAIGIPINQSRSFWILLRWQNCNHLKTTEPSPWWFVMITSTKCVPFTSMSYCDSASQAGVDPGVVLNGIVLAVNEVACGPPKSKCMFLCGTAKINPSKIVMDKHVCGMRGSASKRYPEFWSWKFSSILGRIDSLWFVYLSPIATTLVFWSPNHPSDVFSYGIFFFFRRCYCLLCVGYSTNHPMNAL